MRSFLRFGIFLGIIVLAMLGYERLPSSAKFWTPLNPDEKPGLFTRHKLQQFHNDLAACEAYLQRAGIRYRMIGDQNRGECALKGQILLQQSAYPYSASVTATCPLIAAISLWEKHVLAPAATEHLSSSISRIEHYGIFSCRNVRGSSTRRSQHAEANAIDISGFTLSNNSLISVRKDWGKDNENGRFLKQVQRDSCRLFKSVLGPEYNRLHADHFHLDMGTYSVCR